MEEVTIEMPPQELSPNNPQETTPAQTEAVPKDLSTLTPPVIPANTDTQGVKPKHVGGRPCEFCKNAEAVQTKAEDYIAHCRTDAKFIPFIEELADKLNVDSDTIVNWATKKNEDGTLEHPRFFGTYKSIINHQRLKLLRRSLGRYTPAGAIFQLKANHGMIETEKQILMGEKNAEPIQIEFISEKQLPQNE